MLGALIYAIRDMVVAPAHMGDLPTVIGHVLRLLLGAIFGLIVGYVNLASTSAGGVAASPLLLSLVGGYATDAMLLILDRVALAMSYGERRSRPMPGDELTEEVAPTKKDQSGGSAAVPSEVRSADARQ